MLGAATAELNTSARAARIRPLLELSVRGLESMFYPERNLFSYKLTRTPEGLVKEGISVRYTIIALLGLQRAEKIGLRPGFDTRRIFDGLFRGTRSIDNAGDWGLLFWLCALRAPEELPHLIVRAGLDSHTCGWRVLPPCGPCRIWRFAPTA
jgi:hypothetical protein